MDGQPHQLPCIGANEKEGLWSSLIKIVKHKCKDGKDTLEPRKTYFNPHATLQKVRVINMESLFAKAQQNIATHRKFLELVHTLPKGA